MLDTMHGINVGDYVLCSSDGQSFELGRVAEVIGDEGARVCFSSGCTSALTSVYNLYPLKNADTIVESSLGHHRFDDKCPDYSEDACGGICAYTKSLEELIPF